MLMEMDIRNEPLQYQNTEKVDKTSHSCGDKEHRGSSQYRPETVLTEGQDVSCAKSSSLCFLISLAVSYRNAYYWSCRQTWFVSGLSKG
ncbi:hypothetical protein SRHO_G00250680 [Serrasalmus rhombeus]